MYLPTTTRFMYVGAILAGLLLPMARLDAATVVFDTNSQVPATAGNCWPWGDARTVRYQLLFPQPTLAGYTGTLQWIQHFADGSANPNAVYDVDIYASTTPRTVGHFPMTDLDLNHGPNKALIFSGNLSFPSPDMRINVNPSFVYDGSGNLLLDYVFHSFTGVAEGYDSPYCQAMPANATYYRIYEHPQQGHAAFSSGTIRTQLGFTDPVPPVAPPAVPATVDLVAKGGEWKYLHPTNGADPGVGSTFQLPGFRDTTWLSGPAPLGYGQSDHPGLVLKDIGTPASGNRYTAYFRKTFHVTDPAAYRDLSVELCRDDGLIVYLNGHRLLDPNMPVGTVGYTTLAIAPIGQDLEVLYTRFDHLTNYLLPGENLLAVEVHQDDPTSSDLSFDMRLMAAPVPEPSTLALLGIGAVALLGRTWRRRRRS